MELCAKCSFFWVDTNHFSDFITNLENKSAKQLLFHIHIDICLEKVFIPYKMNLLWSSQRLQIFLKEKITYTWFYVNRTYIILHFELHLTPATACDFFLTKIKKSTQLLCLVFYPLFLGLHTITLISRNSPQQSKQYKW